MDNSNEQVEIPNHEELKKKTSYTYWVKNDPNQPKIECKPQKVEQPIQLTKKESNTGHSEWNASGTWEERTIKVDEIRKALNQLLEKGFELSQNILITAAKSVTGESHLFLVRGKKRMSFHLSITLIFDGLNDLNDQNGEIIYTDFTDDGDREYNVSSESNQKKQINEEVKNNIEKLNDMILGVLNQFKQ